MSTRATYLFTNNSMAAEDICVYIHQSILERHSLSQRLTAAQF